MVTPPRGLREALLALLAAGLTLATLWVGGDARALRGLETLSLDWRMRLRGAIPPGPEVVLVLVDDRSLAALGRWPFSRRVLARLVRAVDAQNPSAIVFDLLFSEPERPVPDALRGAAREAARRLSRDKAVADALRRLAADDPDAELAAAVRRSGRVLLPFAFHFDQAAGQAEAPELIPHAYAGFDRSPEPPHFALEPKSVLMPIPELARAAAGLGHVNVAFDADGAPRYEYLALPFAADFLPSLSVRAVALHLGVDWPEVAVALGGGVRVGQLFAPTDRGMRMLVNYRGPRGTFPTYAFVDVVEGRVPPDVFTGRIVLVGAAAVGINDTFRIPFGAEPLPGVERMANVIDTILRQDFIQRPSWLSLAELVAVLALAALAGALSAEFSTGWGVALWMAALAGWCGGAQLLLARGWWLSVAMPLSALAGALLMVLTYRFGVVDRERRRVKAAFRHYLAPAMVAELALHPERLRLGGETRDMTVLFCDIRNFTTLSETMAPEELVRLINRFLTPMTEVIQSHQGTVDKYIGDCVMAFWNAPLSDRDHARHACVAALAMLRAAEELNRTLDQDGAGGLRIAVGIGLNTGSCCVGNLGSEQRFDYSVVGDTVNVASRMEGLTKTYGVPVVAGDATRAAAPDLPWVVLDKVRVKGRAEPVRVHTLWLGRPEEAGAIDARQAELLRAVEEGRGGDARPLLAELGQLAGRRLEVAHGLLAERLGAE